MSSTRILIADDHAFMRRSLRTILEASQKYEVCGEAGDGRQTVQSAEHLAPNILIVNISATPPNGLEVAPQIRPTSPDTKILMITTHD